MMRLPAADSAVIEPSKLRDYLLSPSHPIGRFKATFFAAIGFPQERWEDLLHALKRLAIDGEATRTALTAHGQKYEVRGSLGGAGVHAAVVTVWIVRTGEVAPRFVTAFPDNKS